MLAKSVILVAAAASGSAYSGELKEHLSRPVAATFETTKKPYDLEICVADVLTVLGTPTSLRSGPDSVVLAASNPMAGSYVGSATITSTSRGSKIDLRIRGKGWDDRMRARMEQCL